MAALHPAHAGFVNPLNHAITADEHAWLRQREIIGLRRETLRDRLAELGLIAGERR